MQKSVRRQLLVGAGIAAAVSISLAGITPAAVSAECDTTGRPISGPAHFVHEQLGEPGEPTHVVDQTICEAGL